MTLPVISAVKNEDIPNIARIAPPIWHQHYDPIIGEKQVDYMLEKFQSEKAIHNQMSEGYLYFKVEEDGESVGYFSLEQRDEVDLFISKFYLFNKTRGKGFGRAMLEFIEVFAVKNNCENVKLTVNKYNPAYKIYLKLGFIKYGSAEFDIGGGFIMDDYLMSKKV